MNPAGLAQAVVEAANPLPQNRFNAARGYIERQPCMNPLGPLVWTTVEARVFAKAGSRWRDMTNGVFWMVGE
jgi:hypothetical protein